MTSSGYLVSECPQPLPSFLCHFNPREFAQGAGEGAACCRSAAVSVLGFPCLFCAVFKTSKIISLPSSSSERVLFNFHASALKSGKGRPLLKRLVVYFSILTSLQYLLSPLHLDCVLHLCTGTCIISFLHVYMQLPVHIYSAQLFIYRTHTHTQSLFTQKITLLLTKWDFIVATLDLTFLENTRSKSEEQLAMLLNSSTDSHKYFPGSSALVL